MTPEEHHDYRLVDLPGYMAWSRQQLQYGESEALIAHLDSTSAWLSKTDVEDLNNEFFDELLEELKEELKRFEN